jgi:hypothetical protein
MDALVPTCAQFQTAGSVEPQVLLKQQVRDVRWTAASRGVILTRRLMEGAEIAVIVASGNIGVGGCSERAAMVRMNDGFDPDFGSALAAASAIRSRRLSSRELTEHIFARIDAFQPRLNAYTYQLREEALAAAARADETLVHQGDVGIFQGVPVNVKSSIASGGPSS